MVFQFRDSTFCVGKWTSSVDVKKDECTLEAIVAPSSNVGIAQLCTVPFTDKDGIPIRLTSAAHEFLNSAVNKHWSHVNLTEYQK